VIVAAKVGDAAAAASEVAELAEVVVGESDREAIFRAIFGKTPLLRDALVEAGIQLDGSAAIFGQAGFPTAILPVTDADKLRGLLDKLRRQNAADTIEHRGHQVNSWTQDGVATSLVVLDGWMILRAAPPAAGLGWLDQILAAPGGGSLGGDGDLADAVRRAAEALGDRASAVALVRFDRLAREVEDWKGAPRELPACARSVAAVAPRLVAGVRVADSGIESWSALDLTAAAAGALRDHAGPPAPGGYYTYRAKAPLAVLLAVHLSWLEKVRAAAGCPLVEPIRDPVRQMTGMAGPRAVYAAATRIDVDSLDGGGVVHMVLTDPELVNAQLESIPGRSLFERKRTIAGREVKALSFPGAPTILYRQEGRRFTAALGDRAMAAVLGPGAPPAQLEIAGAWLEPGRIRNLEGLIAIRWPRRIAHAVAEWLRRYQRAALVLQLEGDSLVFRASLRRKN
jgi:hypothetical protein